MMIAIPSARRAIVLPAMVLAIGLALPAAKAQESEVRRWVSRNAKFTIQARLIDADDDSLTLKTVEGRTIVVELDKLNQASVDYARNWLAKRDEKNQQQPAPGTRPDFLGDPINLLALIDPKRDAYRSEWKKEGTDLVTVSTSRPMVKVPYQPPPQYRLTTKLTPNGRFSLTICVDGNWGLLVFDGPNKTGLVWVDGKNEPFNTTYYRKPLIKPGKEVEIVCTAHRNHLNVTWDGVTIMDWCGNPKRIALSERYWPAALKNRFVIGSHRTALRVSKYELTPILQSEWDNFQPAKQNEDATSNLALLEHTLGSGSGFLISPKMLVTNSHVIDFAPINDLKVYFPEQRTPLPVLGVLFEDPERDLAILSIDTNRTPLPLAFDGNFPESKAVRVLGNPSLSGGVVLRNASVTGTAKATVRIGKLDFLQVDAEVNPGSSGGPMLNPLGQVIGVTTLKATDQGERLLREGLRRLDDSLAKSSPGTGKKGVAFAVPVYDLAVAFDRARSLPPDEVARNGQVHDYRVAFQRLTVMSANRVFYAMANASNELYASAVQAKATGRIKDEDLAPLMPPVAARQLREELRSKKVTARLAVLEKDLDKLVRNVMSGTLPLRAKRNLQQLLKKKKELDAFAARPGNDYRRFSAVILRARDELRQLADEAEQDLSAAAN